MCERECVRVSDKRVCKAVSERVCMQGRDCKDVSERVCHQWVDSSVSSTSPCALSGSL